MVTRKTAKAKPRKVQAKVKAKENGAGPCPVVHFEIGCAQRDGAVEFYSKLFGWKTKQIGPVVSVDTGKKGIGGNITTLGYQAFQYTMFYVAVDDVDDMIGRALKLGGKIMVPPVKIPNGRFAWILDPEGNTIGLWQKD